MFNLFFTNENHYGSFSDLIIVVKPYLWHFTKLTKAKEITWLKESAYSVKQGWIRKSHYWECLPMSTLTTWSTWVMWHDAVVIIVAGNIDFVDESCHFRQQRINNSQATTSCQQQNRVQQNTFTSYHVGKVVLGQRVLVTPGCWCLIVNKNIQIRHPHISCPTSVTNIDVTSDSGF